MFSKTNALKGRLLLAWHCVVIHPTPTIYRLSVSRLNGAELELEAAVLLVVVVASVDIWKEQPTCGCDGCLRSTGVMSSHPRPLPDQ